MDTTVTRSRDEIFIDLPPLGFRRGGRGMIGWVIGYALILLVALPFSIGVVVTVLRGGSARPGDYFCSAIAFMFLAATVYLLAKSITIGKRRFTIRATRHELTAEATGLHRSRRHTWLRDDIDLIRVKRSKLPVNNVVLPELEILAGGEGVLLAGQRDEAELQEICRTLGEHLGLQTGDGWTPGSTERRPIPAPARTDVRLNAPGRGRLTVEIPVRGKLSGFVSFLCGLATLATIVAAVVRYQLWLPASWNSTNVPPLHVGAIAVCLLALWSLRKVLVPRVAAHVAIAVADGALSVVAPRLVGDRAPSWPREQIERVGVEYLMVTGAAEGIGYVPVLQIVVQTSEGTNGIVRLDALLNPDRRREYEFYWIADQIQRALAT